MAKQLSISIEPNQLKQKRMRNSSRFAGMNHEEETARVAADVVEFLKTKKAQHFECGASANVPEEERVPQKWTDLEIINPNIKSY